MSKLENSDEKETDSSCSDKKIIRGNVKKYRLKRKGDQLKINPTEEELNYRKTFKTLDVVIDLPKLICCTKCSVSFKNDILEGKEINSHPLLNVLMCSKCNTFYGDGEFSLDEDNEDKYCRWCGEGGKLFLCSKCICGFCPKCIKMHFGPKKVAEIKKDDDWLCYFCNPQPLWKLRNVCELAKVQSLAKRIGNREESTGSLMKCNSKSTVSNRASESAEKEDEDDYRTASQNGNKTRKSFRIRKRKSSESILSEGSSSISSNKSWNRHGEPAAKARRISRTSLRDGGRKTAAPQKNSLSNSLSSSDSESENSNSSILKEKDMLGKNKHTMKLKEILRVTEITTEVCSQLCKKTFRKLNKKHWSDEKLNSDCENLKSMIILMSSSLSTVHNMIISLQSKLNAKGLDNVFCGDSGISLRKTIGRFLMEKRVKTSHLVSVVNDILNRYPYIALGARLLNDSVCESDNKHGSCNNDLCDTHQVEPLSSGSFNSDKPNEENNSLKNDSKNECSRNYTYSNENLYCGSDYSTDIFELDNGRSETNSEHVSSRNENNDEIMKDGVSNFDVDLKNVYENSCLMKEQLLRDSSGEESLNFSEISDSSISDFDSRRRMVNRNKSEGMERTKGREMTKEDKEIKGLTNLNPLEQRVMNDSSASKADSGSSTVKERQSEKERVKASENTSNSDGVSVKSDGKFESQEIDTQSCRNETDFIRRCSSFLKYYILKTTSSEFDEEPDTKSKKKKYTKKKSSNAASTAKSDSESESESLSDVFFHLEKSHKNAKDIVISSSEGELTDFLFTSKLKKRTSRTVLSSTGSTSSDEPPEKLPKTDVPVKGRKTIRKIMKTKNLHLETRQAIKIENERKKRIVERNNIYKKFFPKMEESDRLVLDFDLETGKVLLEAPKTIAQSLKPHQKEGVKFMWDNCFESVANLEKDNGSGCILAHCMGLGKTLQVITLIATVLSNDLGVKTVLIVAPLNVVNNWVQEFELWLKDEDFDIDLYNLAKCKKLQERFYVMRRWHRDGGVLILSYDMMRIMTNARKHYKWNISELLLDPGPDLIICDEGHIIKNEESSLSKCMRGIKTARRIVLTGTPFQNNLKEYHSMVNFIKPNILGTKREFMNRFGNPIRNGQFEDSTTYDVKLMREKSYVLHKLLDGCVQRRGYSVLTPFLPEKHEFVLSIRLTETQDKLYQYYVDKCKRPDLHKRNGLFKHFGWLQKIWTHPRLVKNYMEGNSSTYDSFIHFEQDGEQAYWKSVIKDEECEDIASSGKLVVLFDILHRSHKVGDKVLVFSHSLKNLNLIEFFLKKIHSANNSGNKSAGGIPSEYLTTWVEGADYFRLDGSTANDFRSKMCEWFNSESCTRARLFLISTRAGGIGINLTRANRVIVFDASWNPSHDVQSIFRVYRFGQAKPCYVYRLVAEATMEEKIYERQVTKLSLEKRVIDEQQIERHYTMGNLQALYKYDPLPRDKWKLPLVPKDVLLAEILKTRNDVIVSYHEHDSLLENKEDEEMTEEERKLAWEAFEAERFLVERSQEMAVNGRPPNERPPGGLFNREEDVTVFNRVFPIVTYRPFKPNVSLPGALRPLITPQNKTVNVTHRIYPKILSHQHFQGNLNDGF